MRASSASYGPMPATNTSVRNTVRVPVYQPFPSVGQEVPKTAEHIQGVLPILILYLTHVREYAAASGKDVLSP